MTTSNGEDELSEDFVIARSRVVWRLSFIGMALTTLNVLISLLTSFNDRAVNDAWVGVGIFSGFVGCAIFARKKRLNAAMMMGALGLLVPIALGDLIHGEFTERLLYLLLAVALAGFAMSWRALIAFYAVSVGTLCVMIGVMPGEFRLGPPGFPTLVLDLLVILTGAMALFVMNARVTREAMSEARAKHRESELQREKAEQAASHAEVANNSKSMFLANVSHELRTPLNAILGYVELIQEESEEEQQMWYEDELGRVHGAASQLLGLINDVLDLSKIEAGRLQIVPMEFELDELLIELEDVIAPLARSHQNTLVFRGVRAMPLYTDRMRLKQVVLNLLSNAVKFTDGGEVAVHVHRLMRGQEIWLHIEVKDTGIGMTRAQLDRIFEPFLQGSAGTSHQYGGTGLGLALSRRICAMLGGQIRVESVWNTGSTFTVEIPSRWRAQADEGQMHDAT